MNARSLTPDLLLGKPLSPHSSPGKVETGIAEGLPVASGKPKYATSHSDQVTWKLPFAN